MLFTWKFQGAVDLIVTTFKSTSLSVAFKNRSLSPPDPLNLFYSSSFLPQNYNLYLYRGEQI